MGAKCCRPAWNKSDEFAVAYIYEEMACCRPKKFILRHGTKDNTIRDEWMKSPARDIIEKEVFDPHGKPVHIAEDVPTGCCGFPDFDVASDQFNTECAPGLNEQIEEKYGFKVEGFNWIERRYVSHGQGGHMQPVAHFCIRIKNVGHTEDDLGGDDELLDAKEK